MMRIHHFAEHFVSGHAVCQQTNCIMELATKIFAVLVLITPQVIRYYFKQKYKESHAEKIDVRKPKCEKILYLFVSTSFSLPVLLWLFDLLNFAIINFDDSLRIVGILIGFSSLWVFYLTHKQLGDNWSGTLEVRKDHQLVSTGLYGYIRHPMYSVFWFTALSLLFVTSNLLVGTLALVATLILCLIRIPDEEQMLIDTFGQQYIDYMKKTKRFVPFIF